MRAPPDLRPYQEDALRSLSRDHRAHQRILLVLPTGAGKTRTAATYVVNEFLRKGRRVLWIAQSAELLDHAHATFRQLLGDDEWSCRWYGGEDDRASRSAAPLWLVDRLVGTGPQRCDLLVLDDAHHAITPEHSDWMATHGAHAPGGARVLGLSATSHVLRGEREVPLTELTFSRLDVPVFERVSYQRSFNDLVVAGVVLPFVYQRIETGLSFDLRMQGGEIARESLAVLDAPARNETIASAWRRAREQLGSTLVFAGTASHARNLAMAFGADADYAIPGDQEELRHRERAIERFSRGEVPVLVTGGAFREGADVARIQTVILARPTASPGLFTQMVCRGARPSASKRKLHLLHVVDRSTAIDAHLCGVEVLRSANPLVESTIIERTQVSDKLDGSALAGVAQDSRLLLDAVLASREGALGGYEGWIELRGEEPDSPEIGVLLRSQNFELLRSVSKADGRLEPESATRIGAAARSASSRSLWRCARALEEGLRGVLRPFAKERPDTFVALLRLAHLTIQATGQDLDDVAEGVRRIETLAWERKVGEAALTPVVDAYIRAPNAYGAVLVVRSRTGAPVARLLGHAAWATLQSTFRSRGRGVDPVRLAGELAVFQPELATYVDELRALVMSAHGPYDMAVVLPARGLVICSQCSAPAATGTRFCGYCGNALA